MLALQMGAAWVEDRLLGALWQSVPQNGRVHLHTIGYFSNLWFAKPMVCMWVASHENDGNHENDENDDDNSDS